MLLLLGALGAQATPLEDLRACVTRLKDDAAAKKLIEICPDIEHTLAALGLDRQLSLDANQPADEDLLEDISELATRYTGNPATRAPATASLASIAAKVNGPKLEPQQSWWDRFKSWMRQWFSKHSGSDPGWLDGLLKRLVDSTQLMTAIFYICMALVLIGALAVIISELRAAAWLRGRRHAPQDGGTGYLKVPLEIDPAHARTGIGQLLGLLVARLVATGRLRAERALTHRELVARSVLDDEQRRTFASVALAAEALMYGAQGSDAPAELLTQGNALLEKIAEPPRQESP